MTKYAVGMHLQEGCLVCVSICRNPNQFSALKKLGKFELILKMSPKSNNIFLETALQWHLIDFLHHDTL